MNLRHSLLFSLAISRAIPTFAQVDPAISYYPLSVGDEWQYNVTNGVTFQYYLLVRTVGDTLMPNGKHYMQFNAVADAPYTLGTSLYRRIDSVTACVYQYSTPAEILMDSVRASPGDQVQDAITPITCSLVDTSTVLGIRTMVKVFKFSVAVGQIETDMTFADGFGIVHKVDYDTWNWPFPAPTTDLVYARINGREFGTFVSVPEPASGFPLQYSLLQNYPNPFNPSTTINYELPHASQVSLTVYDMLGREVSVLVNERREAGVHEVKFDGSGLASGVYFYRIQAGSFVQTKKLLLLK